MTFIQLYHISYCVAHEAPRTRNQIKLRLFPPMGTLEFIAVDILGALPKMHSGHQYVLVFSDCYMILKRAIPMTKGASTYAASVFVEQWIIPYGARTLLTDNGPQGRL